jgi:ribosome-associated heat shock protein Hsp15
VENTSDPVRLDVWLDVACLYKTRSEAQKACRGGKVDVNGQSAKPHRLLKLGDIVELSRQAGRRQRVVVRKLTEKHIPKAEARLLYEDVTPPPTAEEQALLDLLRLAGPRRPRVPVASPDKRERRRLRDAKERGG